MLKIAARLAGPVLAMLVLGGVLVLETHEDRQTAAAAESIANDMAVFNDPAVIAQAQGTAFVDTARARAPYITAGMSDAEVAAVGAQVCRELRHGIASPDLSIRSAYDGEPIGEASAIVNAANAAYCPEATLSGVKVTPIEVVQ